MMRSPSHSTGDLTARAAAWVLVALLAARLVLGFAYSALIPLGEAPDESDHYAYAAFIAREHRLPAGTAMTQAKHPPLYHVLAAALANLTGTDADFTFLRSNPDAGVGPAAAAPNFFIHTRLESWPWQGGALAMHLGRLVSVLAGVILVAATYALGRAVWPAWYAGPLAAAAFVAFLPETLFIGGAVNNDLLAAMWATLALWLGLRGAACAGRPGPAWPLGWQLLAKPVPQPSRLSWQWRCCSSCRTICQIALRCVPSFPACRIRSGGADGRADLARRRALAVAQLAAVG